ncbi:MAG: hypothetical protein Q9Q13_02110 [Acidobacteriota bacterium]|nr:hypothetical protein [Acidobacteriota bacterium]
MNVYDYRPERRAAAMQRKKWKVSYAVRITATADGRRLLRKAESRFVGRLPPARTSGILIQPVERTAQSFAGRSRWICRAAKQQVRAKEANVP